MSLKNTNGTGLSSVNCGATKRVYLGVGLKCSRPVTLICGLPEGHADGPLFSKQVTHRDEVFLIEWKGRLK
jgi:hypothetical protein